MENHFYFILPFIFNLFFCNQIFLKKKMTNNKKKVTIFEYKNNILISIIDCINRYMDMT